jgi:hypothetical protein
MKLIAVLVVLFGVIDSHAEVPTLPFAENLTYTKDLQKHASLPKAIQNILTQHAMISMEGRDGTHLVNSLDLMSQIFISTKFGEADGKMILAMTGIKIPDSIKYGAIYVHPKGYIVHFKNSADDISLFFQGFALEAVSEIKTQILKSEKEVALHPIVESLWPQAHAENIAPPAVCGGPRLKVSGDKGSDASLIQNVWNCTKGAAGGLWDGSVGVAWTLAKGAYGAVVHPIDTYSKASETVKQLGAFFSDLKNSFGDLKDSFDSLPDSVKWNLGCSVISSVGTTAAVVYFTAGGGSPALMGTVSNALAKMGAALPAGSTVAGQVAALAARMKARAAKMEQIQTWIAQGPKGKEFIKKFRKFDRALIHRDAPDPMLDLHHVLTGRNTGFAAEEALAKKDPEFMKAMLAAREARLGEFVTNEQRRSDVIKELQASQRLNAKQKAAVLAYMSVPTCNVLANVGNAVSVEPPTAETVK